MKGRFEASWRIVLALALVLSLGVMTAVPVMALSLTSVTPLPCTVKAVANYTIEFMPGSALNITQKIYVYFPDASAINDPVLSGVVNVYIDGNLAADSAAKYNVMDAVNNVLIITPGANVTASVSHVLIVENVTNLCAAGTHTLKIWTDVETTQVSATYVLCASSTVDKVVVSPANSTKTVCENVTFTAAAYDACNDLIGDCTAGATWAANATAFSSGNNTFTSCNVSTTYNITATYSGKTGWTLLTITKGPAKTLAIVSQPLNGTCCLNTTPVVNITDCCGNGLKDVEVTASIASGPTGKTFKTGSTTKVKTDASGVASFTNLVLCANGTYVLNFAATGVSSQNSSDVVVSTDVPKYLVLSPCPKSTAVNTTVTYTAKAFDKCDNDLGTAGGTLSLNISGAGANATWISSNNITPMTCGTFTVIATNGTLNSTNTCILTVTPPTCPTSISVTPEVWSMEAGSSKKYTAIATNNVFGCTWDVTDIVTWTICNATEAGGMWTASTYNSEHTGCFEVMATLCGLNDTAQLTVTPTKCFIATAAYGTPMADQVQTLREFRDKYMLTNPLGRALVSLYYKVSPPIAQFITEHPSLKPIVRAMLVPAVALGTIVVHNGVTLPLIVLGLVLVAVALAIWATRRQRGSAYA